MIPINEYFDGDVKSLGYTANNSNSTIGVMEKGEYEFGTSTHEVMTVIEGEMRVKLPNSEEWKTFKSGESYEIAANKKFTVKVNEQTSYLCKYE